MNERLQAYNILTQVCIEKKYANLYLRNVEENIAFVTKTVYGTLQYHLLLDYVIKKYTSKLKEKIRLLLMIAAYELHFLNSSEYAVIHEYVEISKLLYKGQYTKLVNAVLRKIALDNFTIDVNDEDEYLSIKTSHPLWLIKMWNKQYGKEITKNICEANLQQKPQYIRINPKISQQSILKDDAFLKNELGIVYTKGNATKTKYYQEGLISIQDISSQKVVQILDPKKEEIILDLCAAPGSKTLHIAELTNDLATIVALDLYESRLNLIAEAKKRLGYQNITLIKDDATKYQPKIKFDKILVDAVCSGYGVLKGKSDIKYHMQPNDMDEIIKIQQLILNNAATLLKQDGIMVYSTCTLNKKENELQIQSFLKQHDNFELLHEETILPFNCDGFYIAKLRRIR